MKSVKTLQQLPDDVDTDPLYTRVYAWDDRLADAASEDEYLAIARECKIVNVIASDGYVRRRTTSTIAPLMPMSVVIGMSDYDGHMVMTVGVYRGTIREGAWLIVEDEVGEIRALKRTYTTLYETLGGDE